VAEAVAAAALVEEAEWGLVDSGLLGSVMVAGPVAHESAPPISRSREKKAEIVS
jgi:hypothetical protein